MRGILRSFMPAICALAILCLSLQRCTAKIVYAEKGSSVELPCPCPHCPEQRREMNWYFDQESTATLLFRKVQRDGVERHPAAWDRLEMLPNYSLRFSNVTDSDTGRYWCEPHNYYDLVVVTGLLRDPRDVTAQTSNTLQQNQQPEMVGLPWDAYEAVCYKKVMVLRSEGNPTIKRTKQTVESRRADSLCYILSCSVSVRKIQHSVVRWWEGKKELQDEEKKGGVSIFKGERTSQLHICLRKKSAGDQEGLRRTEEKRVKCSFADTMGVTFNLTGAAKDCLSVIPNTTRCLESGGHGVAWIPLAVCVTLQLVVILTLGAALWRRSLRSEKREDYFNKGGRDVSKPKHRPQLYENVRTRSETAQQGENGARH